MAFRLGVALHAMPSTKEPTENTSARFPKLSHGGFSLSSPSGSASSGPRSPQRLALTRPRAILPVPGPWGPSMWNATAPLQRPKERLSSAVEVCWEGMAAGRAKVQVLADREVLLAAVRPSTRWGWGGLGRAGQGDPLLWVLPDLRIDVSGVLEALN